MPPGTIPAWAGETSLGPTRRKGRRDHPRVGGGDSLEARYPNDAEGPSPRGRGRPHALYHGLRSAGPSPRGRGRRADALAEHDEKGTIPAWAGETCERTAALAFAWDHPRVGGGDSWSLPFTRQIEGPSPRGRGRRRDIRRCQRCVGTIPAWAGETPRRRQSAVWHRDHPRVGGGDRVTKHARTVATGPSPRGRGRRERGELRPVDAGTIPAWAGETATTHRPTPTGRDHPRVGGETISARRCRLNP